MSRQLVHCSHSDSAPSSAGAKTCGEDNDPFKFVFPTDFASDDAQPRTKPSKIKVRSVAQQQRGHNRTLKRKVHNR